MRDLQSCVRPYAEYLSGVDLVLYSGDEVIVTVGGMAALFLG